MAGGASAKEYFIGGPVQQHDMEIVANYLVGIEMAPMTADMVHGADVVHLEADVHATADNVYGYPDGSSVIHHRLHHRENRLRLAVDRHVAADDRQGRAALRREREGGRSGRVQADLPVESPNRVSCGMSTRRPACRNGGNRRAQEFKFTYPQQ